MSNPLRRPLPFTYFNATMIIIFLNAAVYLVFQFLIPRYAGYFALIPGAVVEYKMYWQLFTYMFMHGSTLHLLMNMLMVFVVGSHLERRMGSWEYLFFYLLTGFLVGVFSFAAYGLMGAWGTPLVGASGAVYALLFAFAVYFPHARLAIWGVIPVRAPYLVLGFTILAVVFQLTGIQGNVAHLSHLAGFAFALLYFPIRQGINPIEQFRSGGGPRRYH